MLRFPFKLAHNIKDMEGRTMWIWVIAARLLIKPEAEVKRPTFWNYADVLRKCQVDGFAHVPCFLNATKVHNSADHGISKFVYLRLQLVDRFYPQLPDWPWSWDYAYLYYLLYGIHLYSHVRRFCLLNGRSEISSYRSIHAPFLSYRLNSIVANPSIRALSTSYIEGSLFTWVSELVNHQV